MEDATIIGTDDITTQKKLEVTGRSSVVQAGTNSQAIRGNSYVFGKSLTTRSEGSFVVNTLNEAVGGNSFASGTLTEATGGNSATFNHRTKASGLMSAAFGNKTEANGQYSAAFGTDGFASGQNAFKIGEKGTAGGARSFASGFQGRALANNASVFWLSMPSTKR